MQAFDACSSARAASPCSASRPRTTAWSRRTTSRVYAQKAGYEIVPVPVYYPEVIEILGEPVYRAVADIPEPVDMVNVFRRSHKIDAHVDDILAAKPSSVWFQLGIRNDAAAETFARAGIDVVQDRCLLVELERRCAVRSGAEDRTLTATAPRESRAPGRAATSSAPARAAPRRAAARAGRPRARALRAACAAPDSAVPLPRAPNARFACSVSWFVRVFNDGTSASKISIPIGWPGADRLSSPIARSTTSCHTISVTAPGSMTGRPSALVRGSGI